MALVSFLNYSKYVCCCFLVRFNLMNTPACFLFSGDMLLKQMRFMYLMRNIYLLKSDIAYLFQPQGPQDYDLYAK